MKHISALLHLFATLSVVAHPTPDDEPAKVVTIDWDSIANGTYSGDLVKRAPIPGANIRVWSKPLATEGSFRCEGSHDITYLIAERGVCYQFSLSGGGLRQHQSLQFLSGTTAGGAGCRVRTYTFAGCQDNNPTEGTPSEHVPGACARRGGLRQFVGIKIVQGPLNNCPA
ncbi:hypothetical protein QBC34DRAFT_374914 [Podospora aff. communis PSN243]|uniref:AA1-like domain-containing protein n=1 Tax=Podospora aff. communis PSN243 TaxID=3040156 RepID=A0AAV9H546_9PEZI|nr:hypothetical protein QBC34DRAFT_374914 [Podospora aff. communis PSN243]